MVTSLHPYAHEHVCPDTHARARMYVCACAFVLVYVCVCARACVCDHIHTYTTQYLPFIRALINPTGQLAFIVLLQEYTGLHQYVCIFMLL